MIEQGSEIVTRDILKMLPHRYPFLMVDKVLRFEEFASIEALKNVTMNEPFFQGHFPGYPVMPGVLILEALAQAGGLLVVKSIPEEMDNKIFLFTGIEKVRFRQSVFPGDQLNLYVSYVRHKRNMWKMQAEAQVKGKTVTQGVLTAAVVDREED